MYELDDHAATQAVDDREQMIADDQSTENESPEEAIDEPSSDEEQRGDDDRSVNMYIRFFWYPPAYYTWVSTSLPTY